MGRATWFEYSESARHMVCVRYLAGVGVVGGAGISRWQRGQTSASRWIISLQKGHCFRFPFEPSASRMPIGPSTTPRMKPAQPSPF